MTLSLNPTALWTLLLMLALLGGCGTLHKDRAPRGEVDLSAIPDAVPRPEPRSRYGNPDSYEVNGQRYYVLESGEGYFERGTASWYGEKFHGRTTSSGEIYDMYAMTAAHRSLPLPTYARVTNLHNGRSVVVKINDRGPFHDNRLIDLSYVAAAKLGMLESGTAPVEVRAISSPPAAPSVNPSTGSVAVGTTPGSGGAAGNPVQPAYGSVQGGVPEIAATLFYVQMGAFSQRRNAETLRSAVESSGAGTAHIMRGVQKESGGALYKVRVGPLPSRTEAERVKQRLAASGISGLHIVTEQN